MARPRVGKTTNPEPVVGYAGGCGGSPQLNPP